MYYIIYNILYSVYQIYNRLFFFYYICKWKQHFTFNFMKKAFEKNNVFLTKNLFPG